MRRSNSPSFSCKRQRKPVVLSVWLRKPGEKQRVAEEEKRKKRTREYLQ